VQLENEVEKMLHNRCQEIANYKVVDNKWESDIAEGIIGKIGETL
jgi:hypothetical protein